MRVNGARGISIQNKQYNVKRDKMRKERRENDTTTYARIEIIREKTWIK